jgi:hypothetical protein
MATLGYDESLSEGNLMNDRFRPKADVQEIAKLCFL